MKPLLIYNNNVATSLATEFDGESYLFQIGKAELLNPNFSIDSKIHSILLNEIVTENYDVIFIPFSLSEDNYIEFIGLRFAFHIRLTKEFRNIQTPIVFYGAENATEVNKLSGLGSILFSKNVYTTDKVSVEQFKKQIEWFKENYSEISETDLLNDFLSRNVIIPSGNYATHHSITNEWSIYRWAKALKIEDDAIKQMEYIISSNLYFKYLKAKYPISELSDNKDKCALHDGKVLFIDDELEKGWATIFRKIRYPKSVECFGSDFKNLNDADEIIEESIKKVKSFNPEVVILDFRLHDDDFEITNPENVTGYKILKQIKDYNQGIQVIILSATNKIWNLLELQKIGADYFILKESPELSIDPDFSKHSIENIYAEIEKALPKAKFLKEFICKSNKIIELLGNFSQEFKKSVSNNLEITFKLLNNSFTEQKFMNYAYLQMFLIVEEWLKQDSVFVEEVGSCYVTNGDKQYMVRKPTEKDKIYEYAIKWKEENKNGFYVIENCTKENKKSFEDTMFKMSAVLLFKFGVETMKGQDWQQISWVRNNKIGHINKNKVEAKDEFVTKEEISKLLKFMLDHFNSNNYKVVDETKALKETTTEEKLEMLKAKFSSKK
jgi:CheY-like chemotaxis protein